MALLGAPQLLVPRGVTLVEPDVAPLSGRDAVAEPLVGELVQEHALAGRDVVSRDDLGIVNRQRLRLEREAQPAINDERAVGVEGVRADLADHPANLLRLDVERREERPGEAGWHGVTD